MFETGSVGISGNTAIFFTPYSDSVLGKIGSCDTTFPGLILCMLGKKFSGGHFVIFFTENRP